MNSTETTQFIMDNIFACDLSNIKEAMLEALSEQDLTEEQEAIVLQVIKYCKNNG